jgi:hypothetical protein
MLSFSNGAEKSQSSYHHPKERPCQSHIRSGSVLIWFLILLSGVQVSLCEGSNFYRHATSLQVVNIHNHETSGGWGNENISRWRVMENPSVALEPINCADGYKGGYGRLHIGSGELRNWHIIYAECRIFSLTGKQRDPSGSSAFAHHFYEMSASRFDGVAEISRISFRNNSGIEKDAGSGKLADIIEMIVDVKPQITVNILEERGGSSNFDRYPRPLFVNHFVELLLHDNLLAPKNYGGNDAYTNQSQRELTNTACPFRHHAFVLLVSGFGLLILTFATVAAAFNGSDYAEDHGLSWFPWSALCFLAALALAFWFASHALDYLSCSTIS